MRLSGGVRNEKEVSPFSLDMTKSPFEIMSMPIRTSESSRKPSGTVIKGKVMSLDNEILTIKALVRSRPPTPETLIALTGINPSASTM